MIRLGLRLTLAGGREAAVRLVLLVASVGLGVGLLLIAVAGVNAVNTQNGRYAWLSNGDAATAAGAAKTPADPLWWLIRADRFDGQLIGRIDVAATGPTSPVPPGIGQLPGPGQYYASPALAALLRRTPADQLAGRYPGHLIGTIGDAALPSPNSLLIVIGRTAGQLARTPGAVRATAIATTPPSSCQQDQCLPGEGMNANSIDLVMSVVAVAILFPLLIFIGTATRLSARLRPDHGGPGHGRPVADPGRGQAHGAADQPAGHADRGPPARRQPEGRVPRGERPGPRPFHHHRGGRPHHHAGRQGRRAARRAGGEHPGRPVFPFSLLRLAGTPLGLLQRVVALESAVPLLLTAVLSIGVGFAASAMYAAAQVGPFVAPGAAYYVITGAGIAASLGIIASTIPLLRRITGPEVARNE